MYHYISLYIQSKLKLHPTVGLIFWGCKHRGNQLPDSNNPKLDQLRVETHTHVICRCANQANKFEKLAILDNKPCEKQTA
jgi:hypothetical protein